MDANNLLTLNLKISISLLAVWCIWFIFLRKVNRFALVRGYIIIGASISILMPWIIPIIQSMNFIPLPGTDLGFTYAIPAVTVGTEKAINWLEVIQIIYLSISSLFFLKFILQLVKLAIPIKNGKVFKMNGLYIVEHSKNISPFSFLNICYVNTNIIPPEKFDEVLIHERAHRDKAHSLDIVLMEIISFSQWFNPFYWMMRKALVEIHEYQADSVALSRHPDPYAYLDAIVTLAFCGVTLPIGNNFNKSLTLKRLAMMNITKRTKGASVRLALALTVTIPMVVALSCSTKSEEILPAEEISVVIQSEGTEKEAINEEQIFVIVEQMPTFMGGDLNTFRQFISTKLRYPQVAAENGIQGRVTVSFIVEPDGSISNVKVLRGVDPILDKEAIRVVEDAPKWSPGKQRGEKVRVSFNMPIVFKLQ